MLLGAGLDSFQNFLKFGAVAADSALTAWAVRPSKGYA